MAAAGCAGRTPTPISTHAPPDDQMRCFDINDEIRQANLRMVNLADEADTITGQNIAIGLLD
ncbi:MAG: hypothetical protein P8N43_07045 [Alphaproteobacteria bacterium]|nr:hypothetical protein [Alphaproteobacteria bacterium]